MSDKLNVRNVSIDKAIATMLANELNLICSLLESSDTSSKESISKLLVTLHRLKGSTGFIGLKEMENLTSDIERKVKESSSLPKEDADHFLLEVKKLLKEINDALC